MQNDYNIDEDIKKLKRIFGRFIQRPMINVIVFGIITILLWDTNNFFTTRQVAVLLMIMLLIGFDLLLYNYKNNKPK